MKSASRRCWTQLLWSWSIGLQLATHEEHPDSLLTHILGCGRRCSCATLGAFNQFLIYEKIRESAFPAAILSRKSGAGNITLSIWHLVLRRVIAAPAIGACHHGVGKFGPLALINAGTATEKRAGCYILLVCVAAEGVAGILRTWWRV